MLTLSILLVFMLAGLIGYILLGVEDDRYWANFQPERLEVDVTMPVMFPSRRTLVPAEQEATA